VATSPVVRLSVRAKPSAPRRCCRWEGVTALATHTAGKLPGVPPTRPRPHQLMRRLAAAGTAAVLVLGLSACSDEAGGSKEAFCQQIALDREALDGRAITGPADERKAVAAAFERVERVAPEEIANPWSELTRLFVDVSELDMTDDTAFGDAFAAALASSVMDAAERVQTYVMNECGIDMNAPAPEADTEADASLDAVTDESEG
jgi:hypothetical protein